MELWWRARVAGWNQARFERPYGVVVLADGWREDAAGFLGLKVKESRAIPRGSKDGHQLNFGAW